jgi:dTDP-4-dehydrorhamnose reductase
MKTLITGITGLLGRTILFENKNLLNIVGGYYPDKKFPTLEKVKTKYLLDIRDYSKINEIVQHEKIKVIINCASLANVDYVETHQKEANNNNYIGTKNITDICQKNDIKLIHISTNAVYDGNKPPYNEKSPRNPINYYGKLKVMEEDFVISKLTDYVIIRPILMYGWNDPLERLNPLTWQLNLQKENKEILLVDDIFSNPLLSNDCAKIILQIIKENQTGVFNVAGSEILSRYEFGLKIAEKTDYPLSKIKPVPNSYFKEIAPRPKNTSFDISKIQKLLNYNPQNANDGLTILTEPQL